MNMDQDEEISNTPPLLGYFDVSNVGFAWREPRPEQIYRRRADMDDVLIFDILLTSGGIHQPDALFPPTDVEGLLRLLNAIEISNYDTLKKECLVYFLLKWHQDGREDKFRIERCIPPQFTALADAYWHLDTGNDVARAVSILSDARLNRDFASKIIHAISLSPNPSPLIVQYVRTAKPLLIEPVDIDIYTLALAESSLLEAWQFQRTFNEADRTRTRLLEKILKWCISPDPRPGPLRALLAFPFTSFEEKFIHHYALEPPNSIPTASIGVLRDLICVRLIQSGKYAEAVKIDHQFASSTLNESRSNSQDRRKMVQDLYAVLPLAERTLIDTELEALTQGKPIPKGANAPPAPSASQNNVADITISQSWEEVPKALPSQTQVNGHAASIVSPYRDILPPSVPIPERSGAPRFGGPILTSSTSTPAAPIIPISAPASEGISVPRKSLPFTSSTLLSSRPRQSITTQTPSQIFFGASTNTSTSGLKFPTPKPYPLTASTLAPAPPSFSPASRKQNAFYEPPPVKTNGIKRAFEAEAEDVAKLDALNAPAANIEEDEDMEKEDEHVIAPIARGSRREGQAAELGFSVFGNGPVTQQQRQISPSVAPAKPVSERKSPSGPASRKVPPGAFLSDEEEPEDDHEPVQKAAPASHPSRSRTTRRTKAAPAAAATSRINTRTAQLKKQDLRRSLPGSLMDDDDDDDEEVEEAADHVAPLRQQSPPRRALRKVRSSTPSDLGDETAEGVKTRRRSSRLSTAGSTHNVSPEPASPKRKSKKSTRATGGTTTRKKKRS